MAERQDEGRGRSGGEASKDSAERAGESMTPLPPIRLTDWWIYQRIRYLSFQMRVALVFSACCGLGAFLSLSGVISTGNELRDLRFQELAFAGGYGLGVVASAAYWLWYRRKMAAADDRLCQRCFTPYVAGGVTTCVTCGHHFNGDDERAKHGYAPFRDFGGRIGASMFGVVLFMIAGKPVLDVFGFKVDSTGWLRAVQIAACFQLCILVAMIVMKQRRDARVRQAGYCCCERCGHPFDWQVSEEQLKSYDSDKQPPELITCTECGETFSPLAVYRRWRYHVT